MTSWRSTNGRSTRLQHLNGTRYRYANEMGTSSVHDNLDKYCRNIPLGQNGRASSTLNGIMRRSSDQMHGVYFSNYDKRPRNNAQMQQHLRLSTAPDHQSTLNADDEFFAIQHQSSNQSMSHIPFAKDNRTALPSYASHDNYYHHRASNGWIHDSNDPNILYAPQHSSTRSNYQPRPSANDIIRETVA